MKEKLSKFLFILNISICISMIILFLSTIIFTSNSEKEKKTYIIQALPSYDSMGNVTITRKVINHEPTHQDSVELGFQFK